MKFLFTLCALSLILVAPSTVRADEASHRAAAEALLSNMDMDKMMGQTIDAMLQAQAGQNPALAQYQPQMKAFFAKYMSWASMKEDVVKLYVNEFSEAELKELNAFYQTPVGKKSVQKMPALMTKGAELGQKRVQEHLPELMTAIQGAGAPGKKP